MHNNPFVPTKKVSKVFINSDFRHLFNNTDIKTISVSGADILPKYIRNHPDINIFNSTDYLFVSSISTIQNYESVYDGKEVVTLQLGKTHNKYNKLNAFVLSSTIFGNLKILDINLINQYKHAVNTNQTYAKCSTAIINNSAAITDDIGIYNAIKSSGFDALLVEKGDILLETKDYGFIGGSCGLIEPFLLAFAGEYKTHRSYIAIRDFARNHNCYLESLCKGVLLDIGGILPVL